MEALMASSFHPSLHKPQQPIKPMLQFSHVTSMPTSFFKTKSKIYTTLASSSAAASTELETEAKEEKFDWFSQWYPVMPVCDLDKRVPLAKRVLGLDVVVWWDRNENAWKVFDDTCPHRLAPLSEGRIDQWGRLQCVYHGWCFNGSGDCKFIPQATPDGPPVHTFKKACTKVYPSTVQNDIVWFWPNSEPQYKDIITKKTPPYITEMDDPSYTKTISNRDLPYGYEVLIENLMDPAHVPYAHYKIMRIPATKVKADKEGGVPIEMSVSDLGLNGFTSKGDNGSSKFMAPCVYYALLEIKANETSVADQSNRSVSSTENNTESSSCVAKRRVVLIFICAPVGPGKSRIIWSFPRNFAVWIERIIPRWIFHLNQNLILDSDLYLLHLEERKIMTVGSSNWQKVFFVPTKSDANVVAFRKWLSKYSGGQLNWGDKFTQTLPPSPPKEQLMDRYWSHVVNCPSCNAAYKGLKVLDVVLQVTSIVSLGFVAAIKDRLSTPARIGLVFMAILCFAASRWLSHFVYKNFHFHDYNHSLLHLN